jgi:hypothetical protein
MVQSQGGQAVKYLEDIMLNRIWQQRDDLVKENQRLEKRIKRLEEAGDEMWKWRDVISAQKWEKAKEAKP